MTQSDQLLVLWHQLQPQQQSCLLRYARFLVQEQQQPPESVASSPEPAAISTPLAIERPQQESVVHALKRLKRTYPMIEADMALLNRASQMLMQKVLGTPDKEIIDQMEQLFQQCYQQWYQEHTP
ncbi:MAG: Crp/Fnr family transcriptional regulator [Magnetococcales bacterium]|nr:Crp/Fnr family transcriptional regulator [Magnetococcales bacterium]